jgi:hypothetical protein
MRWFTCTPVAFGGGPDFFTRDSGLMCRGFQAAGCEARAVMPGEPQAEDEADLIRTEFSNLESADWWRSRQLDGVVLYAWGSPKYRRVAAAIRNAGIFLVLNQDNGGLISPLAGFRGWVEEQWTLTGRGGSTGRWISFAKQVFRGATVGLIATDPLRAVHLKQGSVIACVSPAAAAHYRQLCGIYGGSDLVKRIAVIPHPVEPTFRFTHPVAKARQIVCVGRWQDHLQKRPELMRAVLQQLLAGDSQVTVEVVGTSTPELQSWHESLPGGIRSRVFLRGKLDRERLSEILQNSQIFYSSSAFESFGIAAGEALCSGCSVVAGRSLSMASFEWFVSEKSGQLAASDDVAGHVAALQNELACWADGGRSAPAISETWEQLLHADNVAARVLKLRGVH